MHITIDEALDGIVTQEDVDTATADCKRKYPKATGLHIYVDDGYLGYKPTFGEVPHFDRIRRITGYLVGTIDRWNDGKRAEEADRVKHTCGNGCDMCEGQ